MQRFNFYLCGFCLAIFTIVGFSAYAQKATVSGKAVKIDTIVNSGSEEIMPLMAPNGTTLYFVRSLSPSNVGGKDAGQDVWMTEQETSGLYRKPVNLGLPIDNQANNAVCGIAPDGNTLYLTNVYIKGGKRMEPGVSRSRKNADGSWSVPEPIKIKDLQIQRGYLGAYMCPDEKTLLLTMKSEDAVGREDIYVSFAQADGSFSKPASIGKTVNTVGFEISPFYTERDSMLYYATNGRKDGYGDADIYRVKRLDETWTKWTDPENMGPQVNSDGFDAYLQIAHDSTAFFCKEDPEVRYTDIYTVILQDPKRNKKLADSTLAKNTKGKGGKGGKNGKGGKDGGEDEEEEDEKKKYGTDKDPRKPEEIYKDLAGRKRKTHSNFESILFDFGSSQLRPEGKKILDKAVSYLKEHPTQGIEFVGHTDSVSGELVNQILSDKRSFAAKEYLMRKGVSRNRILNHGFGKQIYVAENETDRGRQRNRRCEINLLIDPEEFKEYYQKENANITAPPTGPAPIPGQAEPKQ